MGELGATVMVYTEHMGDCARAMATRKTTQEQVQADAARGGRSDDVRGQQTRSRAQAAVDDLGQGGRALPRSSSKAARPRRTTT